MSFYLILLHRRRYVGLDELPNSGYVAQALKLATNTLTFEELV
jgi:hypothetical protein